MKTTTKISYKEAVELCDGAQNNKNVEGWKTIKIGGYKQEHGLNVKIYKKDNKVVMAMSGTNLISPLDDKNSLEIIKTTKNPRQFYSAEKMYQTIKKVYPDADIEFLAIEDIINNQIKNKIAVPKSEANQKVAQGAYIYISGYTRDDGTKVSGYYRRR